MWKQQAFVFALLYRLLGLGAMEANQQVKKTQANKQNTLYYTMSLMAIVL